MLWVPYIGNAYTRCWIVNMIAFGYLVNLKVVLSQWIYHCLKKCMKQI